ncbi:MAG: putative class beta-lactamase/penicillin binding protein [Candidatus Kaiserbacteria bacterium]|nr:putative class beta-lactamase/penicillin binding protein [Candidatus Kaiserbacteria bacterium]
MTSPFEWVRHEVEEGTMPVGVLGIATSTGIEEIAAFGSDESRPAKPDDRFALFSITKPLVALATMSLVERGELGLATRLSEVAPARVEAPTLEQLLGHRSGLTDPPLDTAGSREILASVDQSFVPGTMVQYCNTGYLGVEALVNAASGRSLESRLAELGDASGPVGLTFDADGTRGIHGAWEMGLDYAAMKRERHPAAGLFGTASDLLRIGSALLRTLRSDSREIVTRSTLDEMTRDRTSALPRFAPIAGDARQWGLGFGLQRGQSFGHAGWSGTQWWIHPDLDACLVLMTNRLGLVTAGVRFDDLTAAFHESRSR